MYLFNHDYPQDSLNLYMVMRRSSCYKGGIVDRASAALNGVQGVAAGGGPGVSTPLPSEILYFKTQFA